MLMRQQKMRQMPSRQAAVDVAAALSSQRFCWGFVVLSGGGGWRGFIVTLCTSTPFVCSHVATSVCFCGRSARDAKHVVCKNLVHMRGVGVELMCMWQPRERVCVQGKPNRGAGRGCAPIGS